MKNTFKAQLQVEVNKYLEQDINEENIAIYLWAKGEEFASTIVTWNQLAPLLDFNLINVDNIDSFLVEA